MMQICPPMIDLRFALIWTETIQLFTNSRLIKGVGHLKVAGKIDNGIPNGLSPPKEIDPIRGTIAEFDENGFPVAKHIVNPNIKTETDAIDHVAAFMALPLGSKERADYFKAHQHKIVRGLSF